MSNLQELIEIAHRSTAEADNVIEGLFNETIALRAQLSEAHKVQRIDRENRKSSEKAIYEQLNKIQWLVSLYENEPHTPPKGKVFCWLISSSLSRAEMMVGEDIPF